MSEQHRFFYFIFYFLPFNRTVSIKRKRNSYLLKIGGKKESMFI
jgi:hypothetical protein